MISFSGRVDKLLRSQLSEWDLASANYRLLSGVKTRKIDFDDFSVYIQFNPERIRSSAAKVDSKSIEARPCFLCGKNRPPQQKGLIFKDNMVLLVNPFPIFARHLTIPSEAHTDQRIRDSFGIMLDLALALPGYVVFYNGPECGASAPDHLHFQAGNRGFLPVENDFKSRRLITQVKNDRHLNIWRWERYLRGIITLSGRNARDISGAFSKIYEGLCRIQPEKPEPMLNILAYREDGSWIIHLIPRKLHRPTQYFADGDKKILLSPASVDLGGVLIVPREEDFVRINAGNVEDIFRQVCFDEDQITNLCRYV